MALTKRKDDEDTSSTIYNAIEHRDPVLNFEKYIDDNERIVDEVCLSVCLLVSPLSSVWLAVRSCSQRLSQCQIQVEVILCSRGGGTREVVSPRRLVLVALAES